MAECLGNQGGLRNSEMFHKSEDPKQKHHRALKIGSLSGRCKSVTFDFTVGVATHEEILEWARDLDPDTAILKWDLFYTKHNRTRLSHEVVTGPGFRALSVTLWLKKSLIRRAAMGEKFSTSSAILVRVKGEVLVPMTAKWRELRDKILEGFIGWVKEGITWHSRRRGFATDAIRAGVPSAIVKLCMRHRIDVTEGYICLPDSVKAAVSAKIAKLGYLVPQLNLFLVLFPECPVG